MLEQRDPLLPREAGQPAYAKPNANEMQRKAHPDGGEAIAANVHLPYVSVLPYDEDEETTYIETAILLTASPIKKWLFVPLLSLLTIFVFPIFLYWYPTMRSRWLYTRAT